MHLISSHGIASCPSLQSLVNPLSPKVRPSYPQNQPKVRKETIHKSLQNNNMFHLHVFLKIASFQVSGSGIPTISVFCLPWRCQSETTKKQLVHLLLIRLWLLLIKRRLVPNNKTIIWRCTTLCKGSPTSQTAKNKLWNSTFTLGTWMFWWNVYNYMNIQYTIHAWYIYVYI